MNELIASLDRASFLAVVWLLPVAFALHEAEEWYILGWYRRNFVDLPAKTDASIRTFLVFASILGFAWCAIAIAPGNPSIAALVLLPFAALVFQNTLQHIFWQMLFRQYAPGIVTSLVLLIPIIGYLTARAVRENLAPVWYIVLLAVLTVPGLIQTLKAGNTLTPMFRAIHNFGAALSKWLRVPGT